MQTGFIDPRKLQRNPWNANRVGQDNMAKLRKSIADRGFVTAVVIRELPSGDLEILGGQHRVEVAIDMGLKEVPFLNVGRISDAEAKKITLVDNSRYGTDDTISLAKIYEEIGLSSAELAAFLPYTETDFDTVARAVDIDLDDIDIMVDDDQTADPEEVRSERPAKTHDILKFRVSLGDAEKIRQLIEKTMKREGFADDNDELTGAGMALAHLLLGTEE